LFAQSRLGEVQLVGGVAEVQMLGERQECAQFRELEVHSSMLSKSGTFFIGQNRSGSPD
jgi:hypothetical protein